MKIVYSFYLIIFCPILFFGQNSVIEKDIIQNIIGLDFNKARNQIAEIENINHKNSLNNLITIIHNRGYNKKQDSIIILHVNRKLKDNFSIIINDLTMGFYKVYNHSENYNAILDFNNAEQLAKQTNILELIKLSKIGVLELYSTQVKRYNDDYKKHLRNYKELSTNEIDSIIINYYENTFLSKSIKSPRKEFKESSLKILKILNKKSLSPQLRGLLYSNLGVYYRTVGENIDSAKYYNNLVTELPEIIYNYRTKFDAYREISSLYAIKKDTSQAIKYSFKAELYNNYSDSSRAYYDINRHRALYIYPLLGDYKNSFEELRKAMIFEENKGFKFNTLKNLELNAELKTAEKEKENLELEARNKRSQTIALGLGSTLLLGSIIAFLVYRNTKRKQRIAEQDRELQIQKTETILKEKELETINAMVSGQEKERLRLASELHDNLGSTLATVRMQVENLERNLDKVDDPRALLQKTNALVNEAYTKVRSISHERNSGVLAKDGLLPAIQKLARTVSSNNNLQVDVQDFGLEDRIANELEITIFRIIQELITNIIKHAQATEASISLTQHDNELNIMIEDNGKGFKVGKLKEKDGMGLGNIERRIEHLEGAMEVDSAIGRGTHISIDIPL